MNESVEQIMVIVSDSNINESPERLINTIRSDLADLNNNVRIVVFGVGNAGLLCYCRYMRPKKVKIVTVYKFIIY